MQGKGGDPDLPKIKVQGQQRLLRAVTAAMLMALRNLLGNETQTILMLHIYCELIQAGVTSYPDTRYPH